MTGSIWVVGSINMDLIATTERIPSPGETVLGDRFFQAHGGKGANQAVAAARSGAKVVLVGSVGNDGFGEACIRSFEAEEIDTSRIQTHESLSTGVALITVDDSGENCIVVAPGANASLDAERVRDGLTGLEPASVCVCQLETPLDGVREALSFASSAGVTTILNPAPAADLDDEIYATLDCLTPNESETEILTGIRPTDQQSAETAGTRLLDKGVSCVIVTLGRDGAVLVDGDGSLHHPAPEVTAVDTTAAGDTFTGWLASRVALGDTFRDALPTAIAAASLAVTREGAQPSIPTAAEVLH